jgi:16S rRNA (cytidine1402-2'-O)-methyltransferase
MHNAAPLSPGLHIVATPIGNLRDITLRALDALRGADLLLCEDTRTTLRLCRHYDIAPKRMIAYHDHTSERERDSVLSELRGGSLSAALLSEAGTPLISDPGYKLVREARKAGVPVYAVPGASALASALCVAGLPTDRFFFAGFLPPKRQARLSLLRSYAPIPATLVFYESPRRLAEMLKDALEALGNRPAAVARELTKLYEEVIPGLLRSRRTSRRGSPSRGNASS